MTFYQHVQQENIFRMHQIPISKTPGSGASVKLIYYLSAFPVISFTVSKELLYSLLASPSKHYMAEANAGQLKQSG